MKGKSSRTQCPSPGGPTACLHVASALGLSVQGDAVAQWQDWRWQVSGAITLPRGMAEQLVPVTARYPFAVTPYYLSLALPEDPGDPVLRQCMPDYRELSDAEGPYAADPFGEEGSTPVPGLVHRFADRALIVAATVCAVCCRHCTRKNTLSALAGTPSEAYFRPMFDYIRATPSIREVLVSGGDPLLLDDALLDWLLGQLHAIPNVSVLRIGTRVPVVLPMRVTDGLVAILRRHRPLWLNTQFNHPVEITAAAAGACDRLICAGIPVSNQAVLLAGVNDRLETMRALCETLQQYMVRPYYVFQCDPVRGMPHLRTDPCVGREMAEALRAMVGGLSLPRFVADVPGAAGKVEM